MVPRKGNIIYICTMYVYNISIYVYVMPDSLCSHVPSMYTFHLLTDMPKGWSDGWMLLYIYRTSQQLPSHNKFHFSCFVIAVTTIFVIPSWYARSVMLQTIVLHNSAFAVSWPSTSTQLCEEPQHCHHGHGCDGHCFVKTAAQMVSGAFRRVYLGLNSESIGFHRVR